MSNSFVADGPLSEDAKADIQGFVTSGYGHLPNVAYVLLQFHDAVTARRWLGNLVPRITSASSWRPSPGEVKRRPNETVNVAFTHHGLAALGLSQQTLCSFPRAFREGMAEPARAAQVLGDTAESAPENWEFGGPATPPIHACLTLHASSEEGLKSLLLRHLEGVAQTNGGLAVIPEGEQRGYRPENEKEHFGFRDGIAQPDIVGIKGQAGVGVLPTGDFILGYPDHYGVVPSGPVAPAEEDSSAALPAFSNPFHKDLGLRDLGRHGTYLVYRKIEQDVASFWRFVQQEAELLKAATGTGDAIWLAAKLMGRWPSGAPLVLTPERDDAGLGARDDFSYADEDPDGRRCPLGAHIRRSNPRDMIRPSAKEQSVNMSRAHRIRRQGSIYGPRLEHSFPNSGHLLAELQNAGAPRGLHFLAVNANIERQFELLQQQWINNPAFNGVSDNQDPIVGARSGSNQAPSRMIIPSEQGSWRTQPLPRFVTVHGGAYFFLPGIRALRFLAALQ